MRRIWHCGRQYCVSTSMQSMVFSGTGVGYRWGKLGQAWCDFLVGEVSVIPSREGADSEDRRARVLVSEERPRVSFCNQSGHTRIWDCDRVWSCRSLDGQRNISPCTSASSRLFACMSSNLHFPLKVEFQPLKGLRTDSAGGRVGECT